MLERTLTIIKPDAVEKESIGEITGIIEKAGYRIVAAQMFHPTKKEAESFYEMHREKEFFEELTEYASSGPIVVYVLEKENCVEDFRKLIGVTDPAEAAENTIRKKFGTTVRRNSIHGSDSIKSAQREIGFFFPGIKLI